jgi:hypothetical protein
MPHTCTCRVVGVAAEVHVLRRTAQVTGGAYGVSLSESHLSELLLAHAPHLFRHHNTKHTRMCMCNNVDVWRLCRDPLASERAFHGLTQAQCAAHRYSRTG